MTVRTRFAPSPTGYLHIGGVRTALFNWLYARQHGGQFILRIDDTDQVRNVSEALTPILHGFRWLGLDWDEGPEVSGDHGPYFQSQRLDRYRQAVETLLAGGQAYWDYATPEEMKAEMEAAEKEKRPKIYSRRWMAQSEEDRQRFEAEGRVGSVRLKMPRAGTCQFTDRIRGEMSVEWANEQDIVIQRSDGTVTYNLASVVDDADMQITHVIRAEEHLANTARQIFMVDALGYPRPEYAHVPFVAEPGSKNKLSKRKIPQYLKNVDFKKVYEHGKAIADRLGLETTPDAFNPVLVEFYERVGYLPDAIVNYLLLLGWAHEDGKTEEFTRDEMIQQFTLERVNKSAASFDAKKLFAFQERYMQALPLQERIAKVRPYLEAQGLLQGPAADEMLEAVVREAGPRLVTAGDILDYAFFFVPDDQVAYEPKAVEKHLSKSPGLELLPRLAQVLEAVEPLDAASIKAQVEQLAQEAAVKLGPASQVLRVAVSGKDVGFGTFETVAILGRERCLARIKKVHSDLSNL